MALQLEFADYTEQDLMDLIVGAATAISIRRPVEETPIVALQKAIDHFPVDRWMVARTQILRAVIRFRDSQAAAENN